MYELSYQLLVIDVRCELHVISVNLSDLSPLQSCRWTEVTETCSLTAGIPSCDDVVQAQNEVQSLSRKLRLLEESNEQLESRLKTAVANLDEASKVVDEHER